MGWVHDDNTLQVLTQEATRLLGGAIGGSMAPNSSNWPPANGQGSYYPQGQPYPTAQYQQYPANPFTTECYQEWLAKRENKVTGDKPIVVCNGATVECKDMDEARAKATELAHMKQSDAYILVPKVKVSPKRDVVTTEL